MNSYEETQKQSIPSREKDQQQKFAFSKASVVTYGSNVEFVLPHNVLRKNERI